MTSRFSLFGLWHNGHVPRPPEPSHLVAVPRDPVGAGHRDLWALAEHVPAQASHGHLRKKGLPKHMSSNGKDHPSHRKSLKGR